MSDQEASKKSRRPSIFESGPTRLNSTSFEDDLFIENSDLSLNRNRLHQSQQTIPHELPEGFIESPMWVGTGTGLQVRKLPASIELESSIQSQYDIICGNIAAWQRDIDEEPISIEGIQSQFVSFQGSIHSLYQNALCSRVTDKLSYDIINTIGLLERIKKAANRYIRHEMNEVNAKFNNESFPTDINTNEFVSGLRLVTNEVNPLYTYL